MLLFELLPGPDFHHAGRIDKEFLQSVLVLDDDYYLHDAAGLEESYLPARTAGRSRGRRSVAVLRGSRRSGGWCSSAGGAGALHTAGRQGSVASIFTLMRALSTRYSYLPDR